MLREVEVMEMFADWLGEQVSCSVGLLQRQQDAVRALACDVAQVQQEVAPLARMLQWRDAPSALENLAQWPAAVVRVQLGLCATWCEYLAQQPLLLAECYGGAVAASAAVPSAEAKVATAQEQPKTVVKPRATRVRKARE